MHVILTHENADFDAIASLVGMSKLLPRAVAILPERLNRNVGGFLTLYRDAFPLVSRADLQNGARRRARFTQVTLVDVRRPPQIKGLKANTPLHIVDHHPNDGVFEPHETFDGELLGANTTLIVERLIKKGIALNSLEATLLALGIYEDTGSLSYRGTTPRDIRAAAWLLEQGAVLDNVRRFLEPPLNDEQQALLETLVKIADTRPVQGYFVTVAAVNLDRYMAELSAVAHRLRDTLDPTALFVLIEMPRLNEGTEERVTQLICRSTDDAIDAGEIARVFGGGGHERAAAATLSNQPLERLRDMLWEQIYLHIRPSVRVADLMSYGVQTVHADDRIDKIHQRLRRLGHEGFPVLDEQGHIVGLLTRRQADRALEHDLGSLTVREVMTAGNVSLTPESPAAMLEGTMVESGWGQIPVVDSAGKVIGIVTRTDLIKHWARTNPTPSLATAQAEPVTLDTIATVLGTSVAVLIDAIAAQANERRLTTYIVGGIVRDLLLKRPNFDIDFVIEGDAIHFAESLRARFGGEVSSFKPFGTAKWKLDGSAADALGVPLNALPDHVDFAAARSEFYEYPTALPTVYTSGVKLDLARRDFSINTLAVQISGGNIYTTREKQIQKPRQFHLLDEFGGVRDIREGQIRVLHSLSFIDDPTRILRAVRFEHRYGFSIEPRTAELIQNALPVLRRMTGERLRNELSLLLDEDNPEGALLLLQERRILNAIHPALTFTMDTARTFSLARDILMTSLPAWVTTPPTLVDVYWHLIAAHIPLAGLPDVCKRLLFGASMTHSLTDAAQLFQKPESLADSAAPPSQITAYMENKILDARGDTALLAAWIAHTDTTIRENIARYAGIWRHIKPATTGNTLQSMGLKPGKCYSVILNRLRLARLDGIVTTDAEETALLQDLINKNICGDQTRGD